MKIEQQKQEFRAVVITLSSEHDVTYMSNICSTALAASGNNGRLMLSDERNVAEKIFNFLQSKTTTN